MWVISASGGAVINTDQMTYAETERQGASLCLVAQMAHKRIVLLTTTDASAAGQALSGIFAGIAAKRRVLDLRKLAQTDTMEQLEEADDVGTDN